MISGTHYYGIYCTPEEYRFRFLVACSSLPSYYFTRFFNIITTIVTTVLQHSVAGRIENDQWRIGPVVVNFINGYNKSSTGYTAVYMHVMDGRGSIRNRQRHRVPTTTTSSQQHSRRFEFTLVPNRTTQNNRSRATCHTYLSHVCFQNGPPAYRPNLTNDRPAGHSGHTTI